MAEPRPYRCSSGRRGIRGITPNGDPLAAFADNERPILANRDAVRVFSNFATDCICGSSDSVMKRDDEFCALEDFRVGALVGREYSGLRRSQEVQVKDFVNADIGAVHRDIAEVFRGKRIVDPGSFVSVEFAVEPGFHGRHA